MARCTGCSVATTGWPCSVPKQHYLPHFFFAKTDQYSVKKTERMSVSLWRCGDLVSVKYSYLSFFYFWTPLTSQHKAHPARRNLHLVNAESLGCNSACLPNPVAKVSTRMSCGMCLCPFMSTEYHFIPT